MVLNRYNTHSDCSPGCGCGQARAGREINTLRLRRRSARPAARSFYSVSPAEFGTCSAPCGDSVQYKKQTVCYSFSQVWHHIPDIILKCIQFNKFTAALNLKWFSDTSDSNKVDTLISVVLLCGSDSLFLHSSLTTLKVSGFTRWLS